MAYINDLYLKKKVLKYKQKQIIKNIDGKKSFFCLKRSMYDS